MRQREMVNVVDILSKGDIAGFCQRWRIRELAVFGSVLRADFGPESDVDVMVTFEDDSD